MYEYDYEEYFEPTKQDDIIQEATSKLIAVVKNEVQAYYNGIIMENEMLIKENQRLMELERNLSLKEYELEQKEKTLESNFYKKKWTEILKDLQFTYYQLCYESKERDKCNECDDKRKIIFTSPQGKTIENNCDCSKRKTFYLPKEVQFANLNIYKDNDNSRYDKMGYSIKFSSRNDYDERWVELNARKIKDYFEIETANKTYEIIYKTLEECQKHCDYLNKKEE